MNYYNEHDPKAAAWLRELIRTGEIPLGVVDERNIQDVKPNELAGYNQCHFFAGIGGWSYALRLAGISDDEPIWTGSCPCQPFSQPGKGMGEDDERHLWPDFRNLIGQCKPAIVFGEQVAGAAGREWLDGVSADLEALAYRFAAADLCAAGIGAPHTRQRLFFFADTNCNGVERFRIRAGTACETRPWGAYSKMDLLASNGLAEGSGWPQPLIRKVDDGFSASLGLLRGYGNAIVPQLAAEFIRAAIEAMTDAP